MGDLMFDVAETLERLQNDRQFLATVLATIFFLAIFPTYFAMGGSTESGASNAAGPWIVNLEFTEVISGEESGFIDDENTEDYEIVIPSLEDATLYAIVFTLSFDETDESGANPAAQDQCDSISISIETSNLSGSISEENSYSTDECGEHVAVVYVYLKDFEACGGAGTFCDSGNFTTTENTTQGEVNNLLSANGFGRGLITASITVETNTGSTPGPSPGGPLLNNNEDGEEVTITWSILSYTSTITHADMSVEEPIN